MEQCLQVPPQVIFLLRMTESGNNMAWLYNTAKTPEVIVSITTNPGFGCGSGFVIDDISFRSCGPLVSVTLDGTTDGGNVCADYTNPLFCRALTVPYYNDPVVQWQSSSDTGRTWQDIPGQTSTTYAIPRRMTGVINYRMAVAERANINSLNCRTVSNSIYRNSPVPLHKAPVNLLGCFDKDLYLPAADPTALEVLWKAPITVRRNSMQSFRGCHMQIPAYTH